jgi:hypothetical protein
VVLVSGGDDQAIRIAMFDIIRENSSACDSPVALDGDVHITLHATLLMPNAHLSAVRVCLLCYVWPTSTCTSTAVL